MDMNIYSTPDEDLIPYLANNGLNEDMRQQFADAYADDNFEVCFGLIEKLSEAIEFNNCKTKNILLDKKDKIERIIETSRNYENKLKELVSVYEKLYTNVKEENVILKERIRMLGGNA